MGLPSIIIAIILSALLIGIGTTYFGDVYSDGAADATAATLANQGQQLTQSLDTLSAKNGGLPDLSNVTVSGGTHAPSADPATYDLVDGNYLDQAPNSGTGNDWTVEDNTNLGAIAKVSGAKAGACTSALESAGMADDVAKGDIPTDASGANGESIMYGCFGTGAPYTFFHK